jgi:hypothetical protein
MCVLCSRILRWLHGSGSGSRRTFVGLSAGLLVATLIIRVDCAYGQSCSSCSSGGNGSSGCSISGNGGCGVTCKTGYYACCNVGSCVCCKGVENGPLASVWQEVRVPLTPVSLSTQGYSEATNPDQVVTIAGALAISTSPDGYWAYVTVAGPERGVPLKAGLTIQFDSETRPTSKITFHGMGQVLLTQGGLWVKPNTGTGWYFEVNKGRGDSHRGAVVLPAVGIARYRITPENPSAPTSHSEFVKQREGTAPCKRTAPGGKANTAVEGGN